MTLNQAMIICELYQLTGALNAMIRPHRSSTFWDFHFQRALVIKGGQTPHIGIFKMQPKIVVIQVLRTPEHLELGLTLQNLSFALHFNFNSPNKPTNGNWKVYWMVENAQFKSQFQHFWVTFGSVNVVSVIFIFECPTLGIQKWPAKLLLSFREACAWQNAWIYAHALVWEKYFAHFFFLKEFAAMWT